MPTDAVRAAYGRRAAEYAELFGSIDAAAAADRARIRAWAGSVDGRILDVGCGPGQWTHWLTTLGHDVEGIDPTPELVAEARRRYPGVSYRLGRAERIDVADASVGGVLAWFSLIHTAPDEVAAPLGEFARCLRAGGGVALGFFAGPTLEPFDHAVVTAYYWPVAVLAGVVECAGFEVVATDTRQDPGVRAQGLILARKAMPLRESRTARGSA